MTLEAAKEMDRRCVMNWLIKVYVNPSRAFSEYTDDELKMFAHDALVLLKEQEAVSPLFVSGDGQFFCGACKFPFGVSGVNFCSGCGRRVKWT